MIHRSEHRRKETERDVQSYNRGQSRTENKEWRKDKIPLKETFGVSERKTHIHTHVHAAAIV